MLLTIISFLLILTVLVLIHELGHYLTAKFFGVKVEEFGFGFPLTKALFSKQVGETKYSFYPALIGGFVKLYGEDEAGGGKVSTQEAKVSQKDIKRAFFVRPIWQRFIIIFAGVLMNFILATGILTYLTGVDGIPAEGKDVYIVAVEKNTPAEQVGFIAGDRILSINGKTMESAESVISYAKNHKGQEIAITVETKSKKEQTINVVPRVKYPSNQGAIGIAVETNTIVKRYSWYLWPYEGLKQALQQSWLILNGLIQLFAQLFIHGTIPQDLAGPIGIAQVTGQFVQLGLDATLSLVALLSLNLAIVNVLPIPALDGGRQFFLFIELIRGKKMSPGVENYANAIGMIVLLVLLALISLHDIIRIATGGSLLPQ